MTTDLAKTQAALVAALRLKRPVPDVARELGVNPRRLDIYREFVVGHVLGITDKLYPLTRAHVGAERWRGLGQAFYAAVRPRTWELNACGAQLLPFLDDQVSAGAAGLHPFHVNLAQVELEQFKVTMDRTVVPDPATLSDLTVNPTASILSLDYPVIPWIVAHGDDASQVAAGSPPPARAGAPHVVVIFRRHGTHRLGYYHAAADLLFALKVAYEKVPLAMAADAAGQPMHAAQRAIDHAVELGLILRPDCAHG